MKPLNPLLYTLVAVFALLGILAWLILGLGISEPLVPAPENVVQGFVDRLSANRYDIAQAELSEETKAEWSVEKLKQLDEALTNALGEYEFELGGQEEQQEDQATYHAQIKTEQQGTQQIDFELELDPNTRLWKISSLDALQQAAEKQSRATNPH